MPSFLPDIAMSAPEPFHQTSFALSLMLVSCEPFCFKYMPQTRGREL